MDAQYMRMLNKMTPVSAYSMLCLLYDLRGSAVGYFDLRCPDSTDALVLNPAIFDCFRDKPLDIRCELFSTNFMMNEPMQRLLKTMVKPVHLECWRIRDMQKADVQAFYELISTG